MTGYLETGVIHLNCEFPCSNVRPASI
jgi:hypothetical protein